MVVKYKVALFMLLSVVVGFTAGVYYKDVKQNKSGSNSEYKRPTFADGVNVGQPISAEEKAVMDAIYKTNGAFVATISAEEKELLENIKEKVHSAVKENPTVRINYKQICKDKSCYVVAKKLKDYRKKHAIKDKKHLKSLLSKLESEKLIDLFLGVRCTM
jgi:hypothetical protein